jgi:Chalcone isomerase-like
MKKLLLVIGCVLLSWNASALELDGVKLADSVHPGSRDLQLNGAGVRTKVFFDLYIAALYLGEKTSSAAAVLDDDGEQRMALHLLRDIGASHLLGAFNNAIAANHTAAELSALDASIKEFSSIFNAMDEVKKGQVITLDYLPATGTRVSVDGVPKGTIAGAIFHRALFKIWLGDKPAQDDLKKKLLGGQ